jgi:hypothetical protein
MDDAGDTADPLYYIVCKRTVETLGRGIPQFRNVKRKKEYPKTEEREIESDSTTKRIVQEREAGDEVVTSVQAANELLRVMAKELNDGDRSGQGGASLSVSEDQRSQPRAGTALMAAAPLGMEAKGTPEAMI